MLENFGDRFPEIKRNQITNEQKSNNENYSFYEKRITNINGKIKIEENRDPQNRFPSDAEFDEELDNAFIDTEGNNLKYDKNGEIYLADDFRENELPEGYDKNYNFKTKPIDREGFRNKASKIFEKFNNQNNQKGKFGLGDMSLINNFGGIFNKMNNNIGNTASFDEKIK